MAVQGKLVFLNANRERESQRKMDEIHNYFCFLLDGDEMDRHLGRTLAAVAETPNKPTIKSENSPFSKEKWTVNGR